MDHQEHFKAVYFEECAELLRVAESGLTALLDGSGTEETINDVFRAVHSIKGGGGAFGFDGLVKFAHSFETTMSLIREGKLEPSPPLMNDLLRGVSVLEEFLALAQSGQVAQLLRHIGAAAIGARVVCGEGANAGDVRGEVDRHARVGREPR